MERIRLEQSICFIHYLTGKTAKLSSLSIAALFSASILSRLKVLAYLRLMETTCSFTGKNSLVDGI